MIPGLSYPTLVLTDFELLRLFISSYTTINEIITCLKAVGHAYIRASLIYNFLIALPVSVASNERSFSKMKIVKNDLRNALKDEKFFYLMQGAIDSDLLSTVDLEKMAIEWSQRKIDVSRLHVINNFFVL